MRVTSVGVRACKYHSGAATRKIFKVDFEVSFFVEGAKVVEMRSEYVENDNEEGCMMRAMMWAMDRSRSVGNE
jgi:hypothetical protein